MRLVRHEVYARFTALQVFELELEIALIPVAPRRPLPNEIGYPHVRVAGEQKRIILITGLPVTHRPYVAHFALYPKPEHK